MKPKSNATDCSLWFWQSKCCYVTWFYSSFFPLLRLLFFSPPSSFFLLLSSSFFFLLPSSPFFSCHRILNILKSDVQTLWQWWQSFATLASVYVTCIHLWILFVALLDGLLLHKSTKVHCCWNIKGLLLTLTHLWMASPWTSTEKLAKTAWNLSAVQILRLSRSTARIWKDAG